AAVRRLDAAGQLAADRWRPLVRPAVLRFLALGLANTLKAAAAAMVLAAVAGGLLALGRLARNPLLRWGAGAYVEVFRAVPLLLLIFFVPRALPRYGFSLPAFGYLVLALTAYNAAVLGEVFRAGVLSLERGQTEAAYALGLGYWQTMLLVVMPQAVRRMVPALVSQLVTILKDTSLGSVIPYDELLNRGRNTGESFHNVLQAAAVVGLVYIAVNLALSRVARRLEVRQRRRYRAGGIAVSGIEDLAVVEAHGRAADGG
ncbi:MAG: amino acid ABC transporter permease, partial [Actinobacteria bacterium]|nr:amino acid ABC transporter permease [Actinomycetota bacterium]